MRFFSRCNGCQNHRLLIMKRNYKIREIGIVTSKDELCGNCYRTVKKMIKNGNQNESNQAHS
jgi:bacterioferritin-associated ferredoxin